MRRPCEKGDEYFNVRISGIYYRNPMRKQMTALIHRCSPWLSWTWDFLFYGAILGIILTSHLPAIPGQVLVLTRQFWADDQKFFQAQNPDFAFTPFEPWLPIKGRFSFITDVPYGPKNSATELLQAAQGSLVPRVLNAQPVEDRAIIFCSNSLIADLRMRETGYQLIKSLGDGKGIAEKKP